MVRQMGATMSPFNAWILMKGLETLPVRVRHQANSAATIAEWLEGKKGVKRVLYPLLPSHPQYELAKKQMSIGGTVVTIDLDVPEGPKGKEATFRFMDALGIFELSNNLGDAKSIANHPASTFHAKLGPEGRAAIGESDFTVRLSIGLEDVEDLKDDLERALKSL